MADLSLFLLGEAHIANLRDCAALDPEEKRDYEAQLRSLVEEYARLVDAPAALRPLMAAMEPDRCKDGEVRGLLGRVVIARNNAMARSSARGAWKGYYSHRMHLPWAASYMRLGRMYLNEKFGWFTPTIDRVKVGKACNAGKVISICA